MINLDYTETTFFNTGEIILITLANEKVIIGTFMHFEEISDYFTSIVVKVDNTFVKNYMKTDVQTCFCMAIPLKNVLTIIKPMDEDSNSIVAKA